jgi:hypothetical protein
MERRAIGDFGLRIADFGLRISDCGVMNERFQVSGVSEDKQEKQYALYVVP